MDNNLLYSLKANTSYLNVPRDLARMNSKNEEITTRDGHVYGYLLDIKVLGSNVGAFRAPNSWRMRNSFRKFHAYRKIMFENAGVTGDEIGKYAHTMRPYLDKGHSTGTEANCQTVNSDGAIVELDGGEWTYSRLAVTPTYTDVVPVDPTEEYWADGFNLHICEENEVQGSTVNESGYYKSVGMIHSYNLDRQDVTTARVGDGETITGPSNPLAQLISSGNQAVGEVIDITEDQELEFPPYDLDDDGDTIQTVSAGVGASTSEFPTIRFQCFAPAGLLRVVTSATASSQIACEITVIDKVLCKDMGY